MVFILSRKMLRYPAPLKKDQIIPVNVWKKGKEKKKEHCAKLLYPQAAKPQHAGNHVSCGSNSAEKKKNLKVSYLLQTLQISACSGEY